MSRNRKTKFLIILGLLFQISGNKTRFLEIGENLEKRPRNRRNLVYLFLDMFSSNLVYLFLDIFSSKKGPMASSMIVLH